MNYFSGFNAAERYAAGRPYFHELVIQKIKATINRPVGHALDIACGTGLSTKALLNIADHICATDTSAEMLSHVPQSPRITYNLAAAEAQPYQDNTFDLITVCSGVHWFDIPGFLKEAHRLLRSDGWLVLYDNYFASEMIGVPAFQEWSLQTYLSHFPAPARNDTYQWTNTNLNPQHFSLVKEDSFSNIVRFSKTELISYLTTQSNIAAAVTAQLYTYPDVEQWLSIQLAPFFDQQERQLVYNNWIKYIKIK